MPLPDRVMKLPRLCAAILGVVCAVHPAGAAPSDVPPGHWAAGAVRSVIAKKIMTPLPDGKFHGSQPVTRYELAVALDRFVRYIEAGRKPLSPGSPTPAASVPAGASPAVKAAVSHLTRQGYLPSTSPLFKGTGAEPVTAQQLADALSQVTVRISDRSLPPNKQ